MDKYEELLKVFNDELDRIKGHSLERISEYRNEVKKQEYIDTVLLFSKNSVDDLAFYLEDKSDPKIVKRLESLLTAVINDKDELDIVKKEAKNLVLIKKAMSENNKTDLSRYLEKSRKVLTELRSKIEEYKSRRDFRISATFIHDDEEYIKQINEYKRIFTANGLTDIVDDVVKFNEFLDFTNLSSEDKLDVLFLVYEFEAKRYSDELVLDDESIAQDVTENEKRIMEEIESSTKKHFDLSSDEIEEIKTLLSNPTFLKGVIREAGYDDIINIDEELTPIEAETVYELKKDAFNEVAEVVSKGENDPYFVIKNIFGIKNQEDLEKFDDDITTDMDKNEQIDVITKASSYLKKHHHLIERLSDEARRAKLRAIYNIKEANIPRDIAYSEHEKEIHLAMEIQEILKDNDINIDSLSPRQLAKLSERLKDAVNCIDEEEKDVSDEKDKKEEGINIIYLTKGDNKGLIKSYFGSDIGASNKKKGISKSYHAHLKSDLDDIASNNGKNDVFDSKHKELKEMGVRVKESGRVAVYYIPVDEKNAIVFQASLNNGSNNVDEATTRVRKNKNRISDMIDIIRTGGDKYMRLLKENEPVKKEIESTLSR